MSNFALVERWMEREGEIINIMAAMPRILQNTNLTGLKFINYVNRLLFATLECGSIAYWLLRTIKKIDRSIRYLTYSNFHFKVFPIFYSSC